MNSEKANIELRLEIIREYPYMYELWRDCLFCKTWYCQPIGTYGTGSFDALFCGTECSMAGEELKMNYDADEDFKNRLADDRLSAALNVVETIPSAVLHSHAEELNALLLNWYREHQRL